MSNNYEYWQRTYSTEHMLLLSEISKVYGIVGITENQAPCPTVVRIILEEYMKSHDVSCNCYYASANGMVRVFPHDIYHPAMVHFLENLDLNKEQYYLEENGRKYHFRILHQTFQRMVLEL